MLQVEMASQDQWVRGADGWREEGWAGKRKMQGAEGCGRLLACQRGRKRTNESWLLAAGCCC